MFNVTLFKEVSLLIFSIFPYSIILDKSKIQPSVFFYIIIIIHCNKFIQAYGDYIEYNQNNSLFLVIFYLFLHT
jgi:hypothetical protein